MPSAKASKTAQEEQTEPIHVILRIAASVSVGGQTVSVVDAHNAVVEKHGRVALGKFGQPIAPYLEKKLSKQITDGRETRLYLVSKRGGQFVSYSAPIIRILSKKQFETEPIAHPSYYLDLPLSWFVLSDKLLQTDIATLELASNSRRVLEVLAEARTPFMAVKKGSR